MTKPRRKPENDPLLPDLAGIGIIALGAMQIVGLFWPNSGWFVKWLGWSLGLISGLGSFVIPLALITIGIILITGTGIPTTKRKIVGLFVLFAVFITWAQLFRTPDIIEAWKLRNEQSLFFSDILTHGGGCLGFGIGIILFRIFGRIGVHIILFMGVIVSVLLISGETLTNIVGMLKRNATMILKPRSVQPQKATAKRVKQERFRPIEEPVKETRKERLGVLSILKRRKDEDLTQTDNGGNGDSGGNGKTSKTQVIINGGTKKAPETPKPAPPHQAAVSPRPRRGRRPRHRDRG